MNKRPIETARDDDLRLSMQALRRAADRARAEARRTGTAIVVSHQGVIETIRPQAGAPSVQESSSRYGGEPK